MDTAVHVREAASFVGDSILTNCRQSAAQSQARSCLAVVFGFWLLLASGCATSGRYEYGQFHAARSSGADLTPVRLEYGRPNKTLDRIGNILGAPAKLLSLNSRIDNHRVSAETIEKLVVYLEKNDLTDVRVSVNDNSPKYEWRRMRANERISPGWKYTVGTLNWVGYTIMPGRLFGGTEYNPFTNTLYVNSDVPAVLLAEAAYAKDIHAREFPGTYAVFANSVPGVSIWRRSRAVGDVLGYARAEQDWDVEKQTYLVMYPQIGASTFGGAGMLAMGSPGALSSFIVGPLLGAGGAIAGHAAGRTISRRRELELANVAACKDALTDAKPPMPSVEQSPDSNGGLIGEEGGGREKSPFLQTNDDDDERSDVPANGTGTFDSDSPDEESLRKEC